MAAELKRNFNIDATLTPAGGGVFEVLAGQDCLYSKREKHRFPNPEEITGLIRDR